MNELIIIGGPTASGKTKLAVKLAQVLKTEIISADSRQVYQELSIGTAAPGEEEMEGIKHHFIQTKTIFEHYNAAKYETEAMLLIEELFRKYEKLVMVGGSGLYLNAIRFGIDDLPDTDFELRNKLQERLEQEGLESLRMELKILDPVSYMRIDIKNPKRVQKALEMTMLTGKPYSSLLTGTKKDRPFKIRSFAINMDRSLLYERINRRTSEMIEKGLKDEAWNLLPHRHLNALNTVGYKEMFDHFDGKQSLDEAIEKIKDNTRKYARKQITWFRKDEQYKWIGSDELKKIVTLIHESD